MAVAQVCRQLEGQPLGLELAAAWTRAIAVGEIAAGLDVSVRLLVGGSRKAPSRQQTLEATLVWSHALLSNQSWCSSAAARSLPPGSAAEAVCAAEELERTEVLDVLTCLVD